MNHATNPKADNCPEEETSKLWSLEFGLADYIMTTLAICLFIAHVSYLLSVGPENITNKNYFSGVWVMAMTQFAVIIIRPASNTTRIPCVVWICAGLGALACNFLLLG